MNLDVVIFRYKDAHERILPNVLSGFTPDQLTNRYGKINPALWILWHMARSEDFGINRLAADKIQEFDQGNWMNRLGVNTRKMGTGMTREEVDKVCKQVNRDELENYRKATFKHNLQTISQIKESEFSTTRTEPYLRKVLFDEGIIDTSITNLLPVYQGKTTVWYLVHILVAHIFYHLGQLAVIKQLADNR